MEDLPQSWLDRGLPSGLTTEEIRHIKDGRPILAVTSIKDRTGCHLGLAKERYDKWSKRARQAGLLT